MLCVPNLRLDCLPATRPAFLRTTHAGMCTTAFRAQRLYFPCSALPFSPLLSFHLFLVCFLTHFPLVFRLLLTQKLETWKESWKENTKTRICGNRVGRQDVRQLESRNLPGNQEMWKCWNEEKNTVFSISVTEGYESGPPNTAFKGPVLNTALHFHFFFVFRLF